MTLIFRHIFKSLFISTIFLASILVTGVWLTQSLRFIGIIVNKDVSIAGYFSLVGFLIPDLLAIVLPICVLISVLFTYNKLIADHEMAILRTCGLSNWRIARPAILIGIIATIIIAFINIYVVPLSFRHFRDMEHKIKNDFTSNFIQEGAFNTLRGITVYAKKRKSDDELENVFIHNQTPEARGKPPYTIIAEKGIIHSDGNGLILTLYQGNRQERDPKTGKMTFFQFDKLKYDLTQIASAAQDRIIKPYERPLSELLNPETIPGNGPGINAQLRAEAHQRILSPFLPLLFVLIGTCILLRGEYSRNSRRLRNLAAVGSAALVQATISSLINLNGKFFYSIYIAYGIVITLLIILSFFLEQLKWRPKKV